nr:TipAS antibiotic-recognition domain-containing protein [Lachnospiraceae bacterium]
AKWGDTAEYKEFEEKSKNRSDKDNKLFVEQFMLLFKEAGEIKDKDPGSPEAQDLVKRIQEYITKNMYTCTKEILSGLGKMYSAGGDFTKNIDAAGGEGTGAFVDKAIQIYCN